MPSLKELIVKLRGDASDYEKTMDKAAEKGKKFGESMTKVGGFLTAGVTLPLIGVGIAAVKAAGDSQAVWAQTEAVLKSTGSAAGVTKAHIEDLAAAQMKLTGIDDEAVATGANMLLTFTKIGSKGGVFDSATKAALDMATAMNGGVVPSAEAVQAQALQLGKALNDPLTGYTKLQRMGVTFSASQVKQIEHFTKIGDLASAQKIILGELATEYGGSAASAGQTFAGKLALLQSTAGNLLETLGDKLLPIVTKGINDLTPALTAFGDMLANMSPQTIGVIAALLGVAAAAGPVLIIVGQLIAAISTILPVLGAVGGVLAGIGGGPITLIVVGIAALIAGIVLLITHWQQIVNAIQSNPVFQFIAEKILPVLVSAFQDLGNTIRSQVAPIIAQLQTTLQQNLIPAWQGLQQAFETMKPALVVIGAIIGGIVLVSLGLLVGMLKGVFAALGPILSGVIAVFGGIVQIISGAVQVVVGIFQLLVGLVKGIFTGDWTTLQDGLQSLKSGVLNILGGLWSAVVGIFQGLVGGVVGLVSGLVSGVVGFFQHLWEKIVGHSIIPDLVKGVLDWIHNLVGSFLGFIGGLVSQVVGFFLNLGVRVLSAVNSFVQLVLATADSWRDAFVARIRAMIDLASAIFHGIIEVITSPVRKAKDIVLGLINDIKGFFSGLHLELPKIKMPPLPHFSLKGEFKLNPPSVPSLGINWYAQGAIFTSPSVIGVGEGRSPEAVIPLDKLSDLLGDAGGRGGDGGGRPLHLDIDGRTFARLMLPYVVDEIRRELGIRI